MSLLRLPGHIRDVRQLLRGLDWHNLQQEVEAESRSRVVIVGPVNSGKSTLFNRLHGRKLAAVSAVPGTTKGVIEHPLGPFLLVDTPGFGEVWGQDRAATAYQAAGSAHLILLLLDAAAGVRQSDQELYARLHDSGAPVVVALNKVDLVKADLPWILENVEKLLGVRPIPISATTGLNITEKLLPAILKAQPQVAVAMARGLPAVRRPLVNRIIRRAVWLNALIALQPLPGLDIPLLLVSHTRLVLRLASAHGYSMSVSHARELLTTMAGSLASRYLGMQLAKFVPGPGWLVSAALSAITTWAIGHAARRYFEAGAQITPPNLRELYRGLRRLAPWRLLKRRKARSLEEEAGEASKGQQETTA